MRQETKAEARLSFLRQESALADVVDAKEKGELVVSFLRTLSRTHPLLTVFPTSARDENVLRKLGDLAGILNELKLKGIGIEKDTDLALWVDANVISKTAGWTTQCAMRRILQHYARQDQHGEQHMIGLLSGIAARVGDMISKLDTMSMMTGVPFWMRMEVHSCHQRLSGARIDISNCYHALCGDMYPRLAFAKKILVIRNGFSRFFKSKIPNSGRPVLGCVSKPIEVTKGPLECV